MIDAGFATGAFTELGATLFCVVHEALEFPPFSASDNEVRGTGFAAVHELEALAPPRELSGQLRVHRDLRPLTISSLTLEGSTVVIAR